MKKFYIFTFLFLFSCKKENTIVSPVINVPGEISSIQKAIDIAKDFDTILVSNGLYEENINFKGKNVYLTSNYVNTFDTLDIKNTIIKGKHGSVVRFENKEDSASVIDGFTITNGSPIFEAINENSKGGGIFIKNSHPLLKNLIIEDNYMYIPNSRGTGGGIYCDSGSLTAINIIVRRNYSGGEGGGVCVKNSKMNLTKCIINKNYTMWPSYSGGLFLKNVEFQIQHTKFEKNYRTRDSTAIQIIDSNGKFINTKSLEKILSTNSNVKYTNCLIGGIFYP